MHIEITYDDGSVETVQVTVEGEMVSTGGEWIPGHLVRNPERCYFKRDFFECALDEAHVTEGRVAPDEDEDENAFESFSWKLAGSEQDECREKMRAWQEVLGMHFDPTKTGSEAIPDAPEDIRQGYDRDRQCWMHYLDDPAGELLLATTAASQAKM